MHILYIEDDPINVYVMQRAAEELHFELRVATTAHQAREELATAHQSEPSLILLDLNLPECEDGLELAREFRQQGIRTPIIAVSAGTISTSKELCLQAGLDDYLSKPFTFRQLCDCLAPYLE